MPKTMQTPARVKQENEAAKGWITFAFEQRAVEGIALPNLDMGKPNAIEALAL